MSSQNDNIELKEIDLKKYQKKILEIEAKSFENKLVVDRFYITNKEDTAIITGLNEVLKILKNRPYEIILIILWANTEPKYNLDETIKYAIALGKPIYFTPSKYFITSLSNKKYACSAGVFMALSNKNYKDFDQYIIL